MKKSKSSSKGKRKRSPVADKKKHAKLIPKSVEKERKKENEEKLPRKTRWGTSSTKDESDKQTPASRNDEISNPEPPRRLKDMLADKKKIVEYLFLTVTATALQEIIPDYLKDHSIEELKKLCYAEIKEMSDDNILDIASGKGTGSSDPVEINPMIVKPVEAKSAGTKEDNNNQALERSVKQQSPGVSEGFSNDLLELNASSNEMKDLNNDNEDEATAPEDVKMGEEPQVVESDVDLIELEMRARAIRSLLKAKSQVLSDSDD